MQLHDYQVWLVILPIYIIFTSSLEAQWRQQRHASPAAPIKSSNAMSTDLWHRDLLEIRTFRTVTGILIWPAFGLNCLMCAVLLGWYNTLAYLLLVKLTIRFYARWR